jgi:hypothetical protein
VDYWIPTAEDYDKAIMDVLRTVQVDVNGDGNLQPVHVTYFSPEHEGQQDIDYIRPAIVVYQYDQVHDLRREQSIVSQMVSDTPTDITLKRVPTPMKFFYQFTIITDYQLHMNEIIKQINMLFPTRGYISLTDPDGEIVHYDFFQKGMVNGYTNQYLQYGAGEQERLFKKLYRYHLHGEIDEYQANTYKKVHDRNTAVNESTNP